MVETVILNPLEIDLDFTNPRFSMFDFENEEDIIRYLVDFEQIKELAFQIGENGYNTIGERIIVLRNDKGNYTVLEGNRRIASLKLLFQYQPLLKSSERKKIEQLKLNIENFRVSCDIVTEETKDEALFKISAKHVEGIKTWSPIDKRVFYDNLYSQYRKMGLSSDESLNKIKVITPEGKVAIRNAIQQLKFLTSIYDETKIYKADLKQLTQLDTDVLISRVFRPLKQELNLEFNDNLEISSKNTVVYHKILGILGKAVWIDKKLNTRIFAKQNQWKEIVKNIPDLAEKIKEYKESNKKEVLLSEGTENKTSATAKDSGDEVDSENPSSTPPEDKDFKNATNNTDTHNKKAKYKFFVPRESVTITKSNHNLINEITLFDENDNEVSRQSSEYSRISISCVNRNIVIQKNIIDSISENGQYIIDVKYAGETKHFKIFLNIEINNHQEDYQVLFNSQWYNESLAKMSSKHEYFKICELIKKLQRYNVLSADIGDHIIIAFLLRNLVEYSTKAYSDLLNLKQSQDKLSPLVSAVKNHLVTTKRFSKTEAKALNNHDMDIELLNGLIHDYRTSVSIVNIQSIAQKFNRYFSVIFDKLYEGVNNG